MCDLNKLTRSSLDVLLGRVLRSNPTVRALTLDNVPTAELESIRNGNGKLLKELKDFLEHVASQYHKFNMKRCHSIIEAKRRENLVARDSRDTAAIRDCLINIFDHRGSPPVPATEAILKAQRDIASHLDACEVMTGQKWKALLEWSVRPMVCIGQRQPNLRRASGT
jgi:hypothetical protein